MGILKMMKNSWAIPHTAISIPVLRPWSFRISSAPASFRPLRSSVPVRIIRISVISWVRLATKVLPTVSSSSTGGICPHMAVTIAETKMIAIGSSLRAKPTITTKTPSKLNINLLHSLFHHNFAKDKCTKNYKIIIVFCQLGEVFKKFYRFLYKIPRELL